MPNMETTTTQPTKKRRSRTSKSPENSGDDGKKRGRPRVEKQDESAADRRRTQIRMAQRAYRQRKESTLEELRKRVSELTNALELMNKAFADCADRLAASGLPEAHLQDIREVSIQYETLMRCARNPGEEPGPDALVTSPSPPSALENEASKVGGGSRPRNVPSWMDETVLHSGPRTRAPTELGMGYSLFMQDSEEMDTTREYFGQQHSQALVPQQAPRSPFDAFRVEIPDSLSIHSSITPPVTYSFQESTFARRLHRSCLEQGYQLLLDPTRRPATYERVFKLSLLSRGRTKLIAGMKQLLDKGPHEALSSNTAMIHVGGAGTHYPKRDQYGNIQPRKESWNLGVVGPQTLALLENAARDNLTTDMNVDIAGFEGEWFDPYDVEGYLNEKGIFIDPSSSFAEAEVLVWDSPTSIPSNASSATPGTSPKTPQNLVPFDNEQLQFLNRGDAAPPEWNELDLLNFSDVGFSDADTGSWMNFLQPGQSTTKQVAPSSAPVVLDPSIEETPAPMWEGSQSTKYLSGHGSDRLSMFHRPAGLSSDMPPQKKVIIIDVAKFVKVMTVSGVCIGQTPGFKRKDVDRALALASFDAF